MMWSDTVCNPDSLAFLSDECPPLTLINHGRSCSHAFLEVLRYLAGWQEVM